MPRPVSLKSVIHKHAPTPTTDYLDILLIVVDPLLHLARQTLEWEPAPHSLISHCQVISPFYSHQLMKPQRQRRKYVLELACLVEFKF